MGNKRYKMDRSARAKQFMPFDALKGFREALVDKERIRLPRKELSEEEKNTLDHKLRSVMKKDRIMVEYYQEEQYRKVVGIVTKIEAAARVVRVDDTEIAFDDIAGLWVSI